MENSVQGVPVAENIASLYEQINGSNNNAEITRVAGTYMLRYYDVRYRLLQAN